MKIAAAIVWIFVAVLIGVELGCSSEGKPSSGGPQWETITVSSCRAWQDTGLHKIRFNVGGEKGRIFQGELPLMTSDLFAELAFCQRGQQIRVLHGERYSDGQYYIVRYFTNGYEH